MSGFNNPIVAGLGELIRTFIQSPNYVAGVSGWTINKDGTAEFNSIVVRGSLKLSPSVVDSLTNTLYWGDSYAAHGQLVMDSNDNILLIGPSTNRGGGYSELELTPNGGGISALAFLGLINRTLNTLKAVLTCSGVTFEDNGGAGFQQVIVGQANDLVSIAGQSFQVGSGTAGLELIVEAAIPAQTVTAGAFLTLSITSPPPRIVNSDYGAAGGMGPGGWSCPHAGDYIITFCTAFVAWTAGKRVVLNIVLNGNKVIGRYVDTDAGTSAAGGSVTICRNFALNDAVTFQIFNGDTVNQTTYATGVVNGVDPYVKVARLL